MPKIIETTVRSSPPRPSGQISVPKGRLNKELLKYKAEKYIRLNSPVLISVLLSNLERSIGLVESMYTKKALVEQRLSDIRARLELNNSEKYKACELYVEGYTKQRSRVPVNVDNHFYHYDSDRNKFPLFSEGYLNRIIEGMADAEVEIHLIGIMESLEAERQSSKVTLLNAKNTSRVPIDNKTWEQYINPDFRYMIPDIETSIKQKVDKWKSGLNGSKVECAAFVELLLEKKYFIETGKYIVDGAGFALSRYNLDIKNMLQRRALKKRESHKIKLQFKVPNPIKLQIRY